MIVILDWNELCSKSQSNFRSIAAIRTTGGSSVSNSRTLAIAFALPSRVRNPDTDIAAVPNDDVTDRDIQYGAQWPVCRSWCQCHPPLHHVVYSSPGVCYLSVPACLENLRDIRRTLPVPASGSSNGYHSQFDRYIRADRRNFKSANECGRRQADRHPEARIVPAPVPKFRLASWESSAARPGFANGCCGHAMTFFRGSDCYGELDTFHPLNLSMHLWLLRFVSINQKEFPHWKFVSRNIGMTITSRTIVVRLLRDLPVLFAIFIRLNNFAYGYDYWGRNTGNINR